MISHAIFKQHIPALNKEVATLNKKKAELEDIVTGLNKKVTDLKVANEKWQTSLNNNICEILEETATKFRAMILEEQQPSVGTQ